MLGLYTVLFFIYIYIQKNREKERDSYLDNCIQIQRKRYPEGFPGGK